jgi:hypothetical protein
MTLTAFTDGCSSAGLSMVDDVVRSEICSDLITASNTEHLASRDLEDSETDFNVSIRNVPRPSRFARAKIMSGLMWIRVDGR